MIFMKKNNIFILVLFCIVIFLFSYFLFQKENNSISIDLIKTSKKNIAFLENYCSAESRALIHISSSYYNDQLNNYINSTNDSVIISTVNSDYKKFNYDLIAGRYLDSTSVKNLKIDTLRERVKPEQVQLVTSISFEKNKQILTVDENNNKDFSDDKSISFDSDFDPNSEEGKMLINKLPVFNFSYWHKEYLKIENYKRQVIIYPISKDNNHLFSNEEIYEKSKLLVKLKDYWKGEFVYRKNKFNVAIQGFFSPYLTILIKHDSLSFSENNYIINENFSYKLKDTISILDDLFIIDTITSHLSILRLKRIDMNSNSFFGKKPGYLIRNYNLKDLKNSDISLFEITKKENKEYTLLEFWGTWCTPCRKLTPSLKVLNDENLNKLNLISIAYDNSISNVKKYTENNKMKWTQVYVNRKNRENTIISGLHIKYYPTFILLDKSNRIIFRGAGEEALNKVKTIIE